MAIRPAAVCTARAISVAGRQIRTSANGGAAFTEAAIAAISPSCCASPCIFQFPAIKGRMCSSSRIPTDKPKNSENPIRPHGRAPLAGAGTV